MSLTETCNLLERSLDRTGEILREMLQQLQQRRLSWASARPQELRPSAQLEQLADQLTQEAAQQRSLLERMSPAVGAALGVHPDELHTNITKLAAMLPPAQARSLKASAASSTKLAAAIRTEVMLGERLLRFTRDAQDQMFAQLAGETMASKNLHSYDHRARALPGQPGNKPRLVDGRV